MLQYKGSKKSTIIGPKQIKLKWYIVAKIRWTKLTRIIFFWLQKEVDKENSYCMMICILMNWFIMWLVFNYAKGAHNVVAVNKAGYDGCSTSPRNAKAYTSGGDRIRLVKGPNYFICSLPGHCGSGMKIQVSAA